MSDKTESSDVTDTQIREYRDLAKLRLSRTAVYADIVAHSFAIRHASVALGERRARRGGSRKASRAICANAINSERSKL